GQHVETVPARHDTLDGQRKRTPRFERRRPSRRPIETRRSAADALEALMKKVPAAERLRELDPHRGRAIGENVEGQLEIPLIYQVNPLAAVHRGTIPGQGGARYDPAHVRTLAAVDWRSSGRLSGEGPRRICKSQKHG